MYTMKDEEERNGLEVAVIGMSVRLPDADQYNEYWENLRNGKESIQFYTSEELKQGEVPKEKIESQNYVNVKGGRLKEKDTFDYSFFGYTPYEAKVMNPQTRLLHEVAWQALEDAGYDPFQSEKLIGLFAGAANSFYWEGINTLSRMNDDSDIFGESQLMDKDFTSSKVAYALNLKGPVLSLHTACSTSLVAVHLACQSLLNGECDMALAGGVSLKLEEEYGYLYQEGMILSKDGHCRPFDKDATGFIGGEGAGIVVLKLLDDAMKDHDHIYAVIKGSAINNDGQRKDSYTSPSMTGQKEVIQYAHQLAGIDPKTISYIETHGTATNLGDQIEIGALRKVFEEETNEKYCALGSVKANIGHLDVAAGIAGLIKVILSLKNKEIPPMINFSEYNERLKLNESPFYINTEAIPWEPRYGVRRAGISSFGIGGTNAHVLVEEYQETKEVEPEIEDSQEIVVLSARSQNELMDQIEALKNDLTLAPNTSIHDLAHTLRVGRKPFDYRCMMLTADTKKLLEGLSQPKDRYFKYAHKSTDRHNIIFLFDGLGSQYVDMGKELYSKYPLFHRTVDQCYNILNDEMGMQIPHFYNSFHTYTEEELHEFENSQFHVFILEYSLTMLLKDWGITPSGVMGYSLGEYTAACVAGIMTLREAFEVLRVRGRLVASIASSELLSIPLPRNEVEKYLSEDVSLAIDNGGSTILAGEVPVMKELEEILKKDRILFTRISNSRAVHSHLTKPILEEFIQKIDHIDWKKPNVPILSNVKGKWVSDLQMSTSNYWADHLSHTLLFHQSLEELAKIDAPVLVEIGPGRDLANLANRYLNGKGPIVNTVKSLGEDEKDTVFLLKRIGMLWLNGIEVNWNQIYDASQRYKIALPTYPFQKQKIETCLTENGLKGVIKEAEKAVGGEKKEEVYSVSWKSTYLEECDTEKNEKKNRLIFVSSHPLCSHFMKKIAQDAKCWKTVSYKDSLLDSDDCIDPRKFEDYVQLLKNYKNAEKFPDEILFFWPLDQVEIGAVDQDNTTFQKKQELGTYALILLVKAIKEIGMIDDVSITVVTNHLYSVTGEEPLSVENATLIGPLKVIPQEISSIKIRNLDFSLPQDAKMFVYDRAIEQLYNTMQLEHTEKVIAFRGEKSWTQDYDVIRRTGTKSLLKQKGVYLITGGYGEIGLQFAQALVHDYNANVILIGRHPIGSRENDDEKQKIIDQMRAEGSEVLCLQCDVGNYEQLKEVFDVAQKHFSKIDGIFHCAGVIADCFFQTVLEVTKENFEEHYQSKVYGLRNLEKLVDQQKMDFVLVMSSISTILGGLGFCAYASANAYMDQKVLSKCSSSLTHWISVDWDKLSPQKTVDVIYDILKMKHIHRVVVSNIGELKERKNQWVDLKELETKPSPEFEHETTRNQLLNSEYQAPVSPMEHELVETWEEFFGIHGIGVKDNFFELGGDSLKALALLNLIRKKQQKEVSLRELIDHACIAKLATLLEEKENKGAILPTIEPDLEHIEEPFPLTDIQFAYWIGRFDVLKLGNVSAHGYQENDMVYLDCQRLNNAFNRLIKRHDMLRMVVLESGEQKIYKTVPEYKIDVLDLSQQPADQVMESIREIRREMSHHVFDSSKWPLFEIRITKMTDKLSRIHFSFDGLSFDGPSTRILYSELYRLYQNPDTTLEPFTISFRDYVLEFEKQKESGLFEESETYWKDRVAAFPQAPDLPTVRRTSNSQGSIFKRHNHVVDKEKWSGIKKFCRDQKITPNALLLSIYNEVLQQWSRNQHYALNLTFFQRDVKLHPQVKNLMGDFTSLILLEINNEGTSTFGERTFNIQDQLWKDIDHSAYSGVRVIRDIMHLRKTQSEVIYPVVFTSLLSMEELGIENSTEEDGEDIRTELNVLEAECKEEKDELQTYDISQTPQVILDHQVSESEGKLYIAWDVLEDIFPEGMITQMFSDFCSLLQKIGTEDLFVMQNPIQSKIPQSTTEESTENTFGIRYLLDLFHNNSMLQEMDERKSFMYHMLQERLSGKEVEMDHLIENCETSKELMSGDNDQKITFNDFTSILNYLIPFSTGFENRLRHRYASAGGTYAVDVYLNVNSSGVEGVSEGSYYFNRNKNKLYYIADTKNLSMTNPFAFSIILVGEFEKIQSIYGENSYGFLNLETGIIAQGLLSEIRKKNWQMSLLYGIDYEELEKQLELEEHQIVLGVLGISTQFENQVQHVCLGEAKSDLLRRLNTIEYNRNQYPLILDPIQRYQLKQKQMIRKSEVESQSIRLENYYEEMDRSTQLEYFQRQSYRNFSHDLIPTDHFQGLLKDMKSKITNHVLENPVLSYNNLHMVHTYFVVKGHQIEGIEPGIYEFDTLTGDWAQITDTYKKESLDELYDNDVNRPIYEGAAFGIYFTIELKNVLPIYGERALEYAYFEAGAFCHCLEMVGPSHNIGFCQIGGLDDRNVLNLLQTTKNEIYLHSILGGNISATPTGSQENNNDVIHANIGSQRKEETKEMFLHTPFMEQAKLQGNHIAVIAGEKELTYRELDDMSEALAIEIKKRGAKANSLIAVLMSKGWEQVVAVLGILKAGAAYLPINANMPQERRESILQLAEVNLVLSQTKYDGDRENIIVNEDLLSNVTAKEELGSVMLSSDDLAYVIFTSGSTGTPKGVMISHYGAWNTIESINEMYHVTNEDRVIAISSLDFDLSVYDIFGTLSAGATLVIPNEEEVRDSRLLHQLVKERNVTIWNSVPAYMRMFVSYLVESHQIFDFGLRLVLLSGDWIPIDMIHEMRKISQGIEIISLGGATEASIWSIYYPINDIDPQLRSIPYGKALPNQSMYVLDANYECCNVLNPGEICIGGVGLAKGYWKNVEKTKAQFVIHPRTGERLYRTGDVGQYLPDGNIEIIGRLDFQVKIHGFRIELGEIEANLRNHPAIKDAIVMPFGKRDGDKKLLAYVILNPDTSVTTSELKEYLMELLPYYMVPGMFFFMEAFPLTSNGKINRKELPQPSMILEQEIDFTQPKTVVQQKLVEIWKRKLKVDRVGINNNFFEMGGDSLMLMEIHREIKKEFDLNFPVTDLFRYPTIESLTENLKFVQEDNPAIEQKNDHQSSAKARAELRKNITRNRMKEN